MQKTQASNAKTTDSLNRAVREGTAGSIMSGSADIYFTPYALFLKATTSQIAFLAAVPALLGSLTQLIAAWIGHHTGHRKTLVVAGLALQAFILLPMVWLPFFFPDYGATILLACIVLYFAATNFANPAWNSLLGDLIPEGERGRYMGRRSKLMNLANFLAMTSAGLILHFWEMQGQTRVGFIMILTTAMVARFYSAYQVTHVIDPAPAHVDEQAGTLRGILYGYKRSPFMRFSIFQSVMNISAGIAGPFFAVYMLRDLGFSYLQFTTSTAIVVLAQFFTLSMWGRVADTFGNRVILAVTGIIVSVLPLLWLFSTNFWVIVGFQVLGGLAWAGFNLSAGNMLYDLVVPARRAVYSAMHNVFGAVAMFGGAALGGYLATHVPAQVVLFGFEIEFVSSLCWLFLLSAIARFATTLYFMPSLHEARTVTPISPVALFYRLTGLAYLSGFLTTWFVRHKP